MALPHHTYGFGDALLAAAQMVRQDRLRREELAVQERQFQQELAYRHEALRQQDTLARLSDATQRRGQSITVSEGKLDRAQRHAFHKDQMGLSHERLDAERAMSKAQLDAQLEAARIAAESRLSAARIGAAAQREGRDYAAQDFFTRIQGLAALRQIGIDASPEDVGLEGLPGLAPPEPFRPLPPTVPGLSEAGDLHSVNHFGIPVPGLPGVTSYGQKGVDLSRRGFGPISSRGVVFHPYQLREVEREGTRQVIGDYLTTLEEDLAGRDRLSPVEAAAYLSRIEETRLSLAGDAKGEGGHARLRRDMPEDFARFMDRLEAIQAIVYTKGGGATPGGSR